MSCYFIYKSIEADLESADGCEDSDGEDDVASVYESMEMDRFFCY